MLIYSYIKKNSKVKGGMGMKRHFKVLTAMTAAAVLTFSSAIVSFAQAGWIQDGGSWRYYNSDGSMASDQWIKSDGYWYWLNPDGTMGINMWINSKGKWYYVNETGAAVTGWKQIGDKWYYFYDDTTMAVNDNISGDRVGYDGAWIPNR